MEFFNCLEPDSFFYGDISIGYSTTVFLSIWVRLIEIKFDYATLSLLSTVLAGFMSISVPLALGIVSKHTEEYKDKEISESFLREPFYRTQIYLLPALVFVSLLVFSLEPNNSWPAYFILVCDGIAIIAFIRFLRLVAEYATNFDTYYSDRLKKESDEIVEK